MLPTERGAGVGTLLLDVAERRLAEHGVSDTELAVMIGNDRAMAFYHRRGMKPTLTTVLHIGPRANPDLTS